MTQNRIGLNRAIVERAHRRGYAKAVADVVAAITDRAPKGIVGRLIDWHRKVSNWQKRVNAATDESAELEPPPQLVFSRRHSAGNF